MMKAFKILCWSIFFMALALALFKIFSGYPPSPASAFTEWEKPVRVYFIDKAEMENSSCEANVALGRTVINAETLGPGALEALLKGLSSEESVMYQSAIATSTRIQSFVVSNGVAFVDFTSLSDEIAGSCNAVAIRSQIEKTLTDLPDIDSVVISVDGETEGILEP
jgi:spore germination protein GerM